MQDMNLPDTPPGDAIVQKGHFPATWEVAELAVPQLFTRLRDAYSGFIQQHPTAYLVWSPWGGFWRHTFKG
jgi:hypothetical protein